MRRLGTVLVLALVLALGACSSDDGNESTDDAAAEVDGSSSIDPPTIEVAPTTELTVIDAGAEPRVELRYRAPAGTIDRVLQRQEISLTQRIGDESQTIPTPATEIETSYELVDDGERRLRYTFESVDALPTEGVAEATVEATRAFLERLRSSTGTMTISDRGVVTGNDLELPSLDEPALDGLVQGIEDQAGQLALPFPAEAVGVGARWAVDVELELSGLPMQSSTVVQITSIDGDVVEAEVEVAVVFLPGPVEIQGASADVLEGALRGTGTARWDLAADLVPRLEQVASGVTVLRVGDVVLEQEQTQRTTIVDAT